MVSTAARMSGSCPRCASWKSAAVPEKFVVSFKPGKIMEERVGAIADSPIADLIRQAVEADAQDASLDDDFENPDDPAPSIAEK